MRLSSTSPSGLEVEPGNVPLDVEIDIVAGHYPGYSIVNKFGYNPSIGSASVPEDVWGGSTVYTGFPDTTLETISAVSTSANDTLAGTGARTVRVTGLDGNYAVQTVDINLNGTTPVASVATFRRVHSAQVIAAGSGGVNAGDIAIRHTTTTANVFVNIVTGRNQSNASAYTVPAGYTAYLRQLHAAVRGIGQPSSVVTIEGGIWTRAFGLPFRLRRPFIMSDRFRLTDTLYGGLIFTEKSDIVMRVTACSEANAAVNAGYDLLLIPNE